MFHANRHFRDPSGQITRIRRTPTAEGVALGIESDEIAYRHDDAGRVLSESGLNGAVGYEWDALSNLTDLTWLHYGSGHVSAIRFGQQLVTEFTRDRLHREVRRIQGAREQLRQYDSLGRRTLQRSELSTDVTLPEQALLERLYRYTARGELSGVSDTLRGEVDYGYDAEGRLLKHYEARQGHSRAQFSYDAADNLAASDAAAPVTDNRLQHWQALFMKYDHWGNLVSRRNGLYEQHYAYDAENRLVSARGTGPEGRFEARYHYDALGRRTRKIVTTTHGTTDTRFLWQGYRLLQEQQESGLRSTYVYDPNEAWSPLARVDHLRDQSSGEIYWFSTDLNGAPLEVTDERGAVRWSGQYGSFGEVRHQSEGFSRLVNRTAMAHQPLQYADGETGLHYNLFRYYDPQVGRFIVQDPIGLNGGWNLYQYAPNPLGWIDPWGLSPVSPKTVLFSQNSINAVFEDGRNVNELIHRLVNDPSYINEIEPIRKVRMRDLPENVQERLLSQGAHKDAVFSLDNRRLYAAKEAGVDKIPSRWATPEELSKINLERRFSTGDGGKSIRTRGCS